MTVLTDGDWHDVEDAYLNSTETVAAIAARFNITVATLNNRRMARSWRPRRPKALKIHDGAEADKDAMKASMVARFYRLISMKLEQMEADMARSTERTPADSERETRAIGTLIRNFEKVFGLEQEGSAHNDKRSPNATDAQAEAEAIRRELAERLVRIRQTEQGDGE